MPLIKDIKTGAIKTSTYTPTIADFLATLTEKPNGESLNFDPKTTEVVPKPRSVSMVLLSIDNNPQIAPHQKLFVTHTVGQMQKKGKQINFVELSPTHFLVGEFTEKETAFAVIFEKVKAQIKEQQPQEKEEKKEEKPKEKKTRTKSNDSETQAEKVDAE